jgi:N utilization substance protein B
MFAKSSGHVRRRSRAFALQALYEIDLSSHSVDGSVGWLREEQGLPAEALPFALQLINGVIEHRSEIDELIQELAPTWPVRHLASIDRNILRLALYEVKFEADVPPKAAINEAVELAKAFGSETTSKFVNGVMGTVMQQEGSDF